MAMVKDVKANCSYKEVELPSLEWKKHRSKEYWEYRKAWTEIPQKLITTKFPINLDLETTSVCNLLCPMCPRTIKIEDGTFGEVGHMSMELYKKIIDEGSKNGLCSIKLMSLGEPLLDPYVVERIKYAKDRGIIEVMFNTNATNLTEEMSHKILEAGLDSLFFSVDGLKEQFEKIRIGAHYESVIKNIENFLRIKEEGNYKHVQTRVSMVVMPGMERIIPEYTKIWLPKVGKVGFGEWMVRTSTAADDKNYNPDFICAQPFQRMFVLEDGICTPCCLDDGRGYVLGDANKNSISEIWHGEQAEKLRSFQRDGKYYNIDICKKCAMPWTTYNTQ